MTASGRPSLYNPENAELARKFCMLGATNDDLGEFFGVTSRTIENWIATYPDFAGEVKAGRDHADANVVHRLYQRAMGCSVPAERIFIYQGRAIREPLTIHYPPDTQACIFWLRNRRRRNWTEKATPPPADNEDQGWAELEAAAERARHADRT
jgi:hypothetical protein